MTFLLATLPLLLVLVLMLVFRRGSHVAGLAGWAAVILVGFLVFGLNWQVLWVSQVKSLLLSLNVLLVLWPALILYHLVDQAGGVRAIAGALQEMIPDPGWLLIVLAWMLSALVENLAGFGLPIAIVAPMMIMLGVSPVRAVAASAIGHSWAVSLGGMALAFRTMADVVNIDAMAIFPAAAALLDVSTLLSGLATALVLGQLRYWKRIVVLSLLVSLVQYVVGLAGVIPLSSFSASIAGILGGFLLAKMGSGEPARVSFSPQLKGGLLSYGFLFVSVVVVSIIKPLNQWLAGVRLTSAFPQVMTESGFVTAAGSGFILKPFTHPGTLILLTVAFAVLVLPAIVPGKLAGPKKVLALTWHSALPASLGTLFMIGLSSLMEHTGMTLLIARGLSQTFGLVYPLFAPLVGTLGTFATGSNTNSNVLFGAMQKEVAELLRLNPLVMLAAQTTGGALGSMIAPAKLAVGGSTNTMKGREGEVLRLTLPIGLVCTALIGGLVWLVLALSG